jgi:hypothetical protein
VLLRKSDLIRRTVLVLAILISGGSLLFPRLPILFLIVLLYLAARDWVLDFKRQVLPILVLLSVILLLTVLRPVGTDIESTATRFANFFAGLLLLDLYLRAGAECLRRDLYLILTFMAWQAVFTVVLAQSFNFLFVNMTVAETPYRTFLGLFTYHVMLEDSGFMIRPDGVFYEPGVFQVYLNIYLYLSLFVFRNAWRTMLAAVGVLLTQSTTGILIAMTIIFAYMATRYLNRGSLAMRVAKVFVAAVIVAVVAGVASMNIMNKTVGDSQGSFWARQYDLITGINVISQNPLLGIGFDYGQYYRASSQLGFADTQLPERIIQDRGNSNGIIFLLYSIGIPLSIPFFIGMFRQRMFPDRVLFGVLQLLAFLGESMIFTPFFLMIIYSGLLTTGRNSQLAQAAHGV